MAKKPIRTYLSLVRAKQADETRARIAAVARKLILSRGFEAATIEAIARGAGVAVPTVYAVFGSKGRILAELVDRAAFGPVFQKLISEAETLTDPLARLRLTARIARQIYDGERAESELLVKARVVLPEVAAREHDRECSRYEAQAVTVTYLIKSGQLNPALTESEARDIQWTFTARDLYRLLVVERGWSADRYEQWLADAMVATLAVPKPSRKQRRQPVKSAKT
jgi:TetR/AcrR family transcriptional regulator, regulator of cefoperazone and chloramphenicol sensitivity